MHRWLQNLWMTTIPLLQRVFSEFFGFVIHVDLLIRHTTTSDKMMQKLLLLICNVGCQCQRSIHCQTVSCCYSARRPIMLVKWVVYCVVLRDVSIGVTAVQWDSRRESRPLAQSFNKEPQLLRSSQDPHLQLSSPLAAAPLPRALFRSLMPLKAHYSSSQRARGSYRSPFFGEINWMVVWRPLRANQTSSSLNQFWGVTQSWENQDNLVIFSHLLLVVYLSTGVPHLTQMKCLSLTL